VAHAAAWWTHAEQTAAYTDSVKMASNRDSHNPLDRRFLYMNFIHISHPVWCKHIWTTTIYISNDWMCGVETWVHGDQVLTSWARTCCLLDPTSL
jgi:hypothetical protein